MFKKILNKDRLIKKIQEKIDRGESASAIIDEIENMDIHKNPLESINILFSITESLLKRVLDNNKPCGKNISLYHSKNSNTIINLQQIQKAISIRHETTHALLVRDVIKTDFAIHTYIKYIRIIAYENNIDLDDFILSPRTEDSIKKISLQSTKKRKLLIMVSLIFLLFYFSFFYKVLNPKFLTGSSLGTYYPIAQDIKKLIAPHLLVLETEGSMDNMKRIGLSKENEFLIAFVQNDVLKYLSKEARSGDMERQKILNKTKVLMPIHSGEIHILVREDNLDIKNFRDLKDKKISIGMRNSGTSITAKSLYFKLFHEEIDKVYQPYYEALKALRDRSIDAIVLTGGQPLSKLNKDTSAVRLLSYEGEPLDGYSVSYIKKNSYPWLKQERIRTLSVQSFIVTNITSNRESLLYLKEYLKKLKEYKVNIRNNKNIKVTHPKLKDLAQKRCLPPLPTGLEYHQFVKWDTPWCKK